MVPLIEEAIDGTDRPHLPDLYDDAIEAVQWVAACAQLAEQKLAKGRRKAKAKQRKS
jgi:hypothetical protein